MIFKNIENLASSFEKISCFLIYGPNYEKNNLYLRYISSIFDQYTTHFLDFSNLEQVDTLEQEISNHDIFAQKNLFIINVPYPEKIFQKIKKINFSNINNIRIIFKTAELKKNSKFRSFFEKSHEYACLPCYENNQDEIRKIIIKTLKLENLKISDDLLNFMVIFFHKNRSDISNEIEKIIIFLKTDQELDEASFLKITNTNRSFELENLIYAIVSGELKKLDILLGLKKRYNFSNILVVNSLVNHFYKLIYFKEKYQLIGSRQTALQSLKPPIFFKYHEEFFTQSEFWTITLIQGTLKKLFYIEKKLKTQSDFDSTDFVFFSIAKLAYKLKY